MKTGKMLVCSLVCVMLLVGAPEVSWAHQKRGHHRVGIFHRKHHGGHHHGKHTGEHSVSGGNFTDHIYEITSADSVQRTKMKPFIEEASKKMETLRLGYHDQEGKVFDSLKTQLKPILKEGQLKSLDDLKVYKRR